MNTLSYRIISSSSDEDETTEEIVSPRQKEGVDQKQKGEMAEFGGFNM